MIPRSVELLCEGVNTHNIVHPSVGIDAGCGRNFIACQVVITDEALARLVHVDTVGQLLATEVDGESIPTVVSLVALTDLESIVTQVVVHDERKIFTLGEEAQDLAVMVQELLLAVNFTTTKLLLKELEEFRVLLLRLRLLGLLEVVSG